MCHFFFKQGVFTWTLLKKKKKKTTTTKKKQKKNKKKQTTKHYSPKPFVIHVYIVFQSLLKLIPYSVSVVFIYTKMIS